MRMRQGANQAAAAAKLGYPTTFIGQVVLLASLAPGRSRMRNTNACGVAAAGW
jgi:sugar/nucleoside kinase (ribokinase family)